MPKPKYLVFEDEAYESWIRSKPCLICKYPTVDLHHVDHARKNSFMTIPLCRDHHTFGKHAYHALERRAFEETHSVNLDWEIMSLLMERLNELNEASALKGELRIPGVKVIQSAAVVTRTR